MNTPILLAHDELFQVEWQIARRADKLARHFGMDPTHALEAWCQAEREVWQDRHVAIGGVEAGAGSRRVRT